uniref:Ribosomal protein eL8/eL30/eS12/Gadd45 domain-containing protein n=1 Tax=Brassica oleracea var. oleracea TaxID=109376 RepID=A0A0D3A638_BRAOL
MEERHERLNQQFTELEKEWAAMKTSKGSSAVSRITTEEALEFVEYSPRELMLSLQHDQACPEAEMRSPCRRKLFHDSDDDSDNEAKMTPLSHSTCWSSNVMRVGDTNNKKEMKKKNKRGMIAPKKGVKAVTKKKSEKVTNPLFERRPKQFGIGGALPPKKDLTRYIKWPKSIRLQRQKRILKQRLKVPPALNQFTKTLDKNLATSLFKMMLKYRPEDKAAKKERLLKKAQAEAEGKTAESKKPIVVKYGLNHVTYLIEQNKAQLVVIAHDVDPIELVVWLPALCRKIEVPYCIVKGKSRLGAIVHQKTAACLCLTTVKNEDKMEFSKILEAIKANFNDKYEEYRKKWGGGIMGSKSQAKTKAKERVLAKEAAQRMN